MLFGCSSVKMDVVSISPENYKNHSSIYQVNYNMSCKYENGPTPFVFNLRKGEGLIPVEINNIRTLAGAMGTGFTELPKNTLGLKGIWYNGLKANYEGYYLLIYPSGDLISNYAFLRVRDSKNVLMSGSCSTKQDEAPFKLIKNP